MTSNELKQLANSSKNSRMRSRYLAVSHFVDGESRTDIAKYLKVARGSVNSWIQKYLDGGIDGLSAAEHPGRPGKLTQLQLDNLREFIEKNSVKPEGGRLQAKDIRLYIIDSYGIDYEVSNIYRLLRQLKFSWITSRSRHPKQDEGAQTLFKKLPTGNDR